jgi:hypothetical protein
LLLGLGLLLCIPLVLLGMSWIGIDTIPAYFKPPLVIGGTSGTSHSDGTRYFTVNGEPEFVAANAPILRAAHVAILPDPQLRVISRSSEEGNTPDKFLFHGRYGFSIKGAPFDVEIEIDGRARTFAAGGKKFKLSRGNYFRIRIVPGPALLVDQLKITDTVEADPEKVKDVFDSYP